MELSKRQALKEQRRKKDKVLRGERGKTKDRNLYNNEAMGAPTKKSQEIYRDNGREKEG